MSKTVHSYEDIKEDILEAADVLADPVRQTMSPQGRNVIFESEPGHFSSTNDGVTIAKQIESEDDIKGAIISVMKATAMKTNNAVGDGTSTSILLAHILLQEAFKLKEDGVKPSNITDQLIEFRDQMKEELDEQKQDVDVDDEVVRSIARISANNDSEIADDVFEAMQQAGTDGMISIEVGEDETEIQVDDGFVILSGLISPELRASERSFEVDVEEVPVLVVNKHIYYKNEANRILKTVLEAGYDNVAVVARKFNAKARNVFVANHNEDDPKSIDNVILVEDPNAEEDDPQSLEDLALYLNGQFISQSRGDLVNTVDIDDFCIAKRAKVNMQKAVFERQDEDNPDLDDRIASLKEEVQDEDSSEARKQLASLTEGLTTIRVGAKTDIERMERAYRYEDAIHACRAVVEDGYVRGGGMSLWAAYKETKDEYEEDFRRVFRKVATAPIRQILNNCGEHAETVMDSLEEDASPDSDRGFNAATGEITNLVEEGVVDPVKVAKQSLDAAVSIVNEVISSNYLILNNESDTTTTESGNGRGNTTADGPVRGGAERSS